MRVKESINAMPPTIDLRLGRWESALADVPRVDTLIVDAPYSHKTHKGALSAKDVLPDAAGRATIGYQHWTPRDVRKFVSAWSCRIGCWMVSLTDSELSPHWCDAMAKIGLYTFAPVGVIITGMGVRIQGDGPSSWTLHLCVGRRKAKRLSTAAGAKGIWRTLPGGYSGPATPGMAGGRGKPSWLLDALVRDYSDPGMLVCDPCAGWGSTLLAARASGRNAVGSEVDLEAYEVARRTIAGLEARPRDDQPGLFDTLETTP